MNRVKFYVTPSKPDVSKSGSQVFMIGAWLVLGAMILAFFPDSFFLVSYILISLAWAGFMWWYIRDQRQPQFFIALDGDGIAVKTSHVGDLKFKWSDLSSIRLNSSQMTIAVKNQDEFDVGLDWLNASQLAEWKSNVQQAAATNNIRLTIA